MRIFTALAFGLALVAGASVGAKPAFVTSEIEGAGSDLIFCDLDCDGLKDAILIDGLSFAVFYQDAKQGFPRRPQQQFRLEEQAALVWPAKLGKAAESLLVMTSEGVSELCFTNRTGPPARQQIIKLPTIVPDKLMEPGASYFPLSAETGSGWPLLLVPFGGSAAESMLDSEHGVLPLRPADSLSVWQHGEREGWHLIQMLPEALETSIRPGVARAACSESFRLSLSVSDVKGDGRDDLMVMRELVGGRQSYALYLQTLDGRFTPQPVLAYTNKADGHTELRWVDLNRDGKVDLIKSTMLDEPSFVPALPSGKAVVGVYLADAQGRIPAEPQQVFRKNDWSAALPVLDVDGDGFADLVLGYVPINTREGLRKMVTAKQLDLTLKFHFFQPGSGFSVEPDFQRDLVIHMDREFLFTVGPRPTSEQFFSLDGDFNGDGKRDLLVRDRSAELSVYFFVSRQKGFHPEADLRFSCPETIDWWRTKDLNGDGVSDLIVKLANRKTFRIFTSQGR